ncbi:MAG: DUF308 domain-containing protein [Firmicutes bacterium]|nr:DUF308 domain-containing protein [Bacillota bacterium]
MNKENRITINNLIYALLFLVFGIILLTSTEDLITIVSKVIGAVLIIVGIIKTIIYIYMKGKLSNYSTSKLAIGLLFICFGILLIFLSGTLSFAIRTVVGIWVLFSGINRVIFAFAMSSVDKKGFLVYLTTALLMIILGIILITGIFDQLIGLLIIIYSIMEIVDYIYFRVKNKDIEEVKTNTTDKKVKRLKKGKVVDAIIEEKEN